MKKIFLSSDHAGYKLKESIKLYLDKKKINYTDLGPYNSDKVDYPDYAHKVAKKVKTNNNHVGILVCGSGIGMNIAANRHKNIRAAQCFNLKSNIELHVYFYVYLQQYSFPSQSHKLIYRYDCY